MALLLQENMKGEAINRRGKVKKSESGGREVELSQKCKNEILSMLVRMVLKMPQARAYSVGFAKNQIATLRRSRMIKTPKMVRTLMMVKICRDCYHQ